jgi:glycosyltransferase involved in cell wall biosynthesis
LKIDLYTNIAPHYRSALWRNLLEDNEFEAHFLFGRDPQSTIRQIDFTEQSWAEFNRRIHYFNNKYWRNVLIWQSGAFQRALRSPARIIVLLDQMYILSNWIVLFISRLRGKKIAFWGHGIYGNESQAKRWMRLFYLRRADLIFVYGPHAKNLLVTAGIPETRVECVYNSLDYHHHLSLRSKVVATDYYQKRNFFSDPALPTLIFVGRLTRQKRLKAIIDAIEYLKSSARPVNFLFIGSGPEEKNLKLAASNLPGMVHFLGPCYDEFQLGQLIANADLCVSPGEVGLTAIHSLSFGTPVCTHGDMTRQMPEADALTEGLTGIFYDYKKMNLGETLLKWLSSRPDRESIRLACYETVDAKYNPSRQVDIFKGAFDKLALSAEE